MRSVNQMGDRHLKTAALSNQPSFSKHRSRLPVRTLLSVVVIFNSILLLTVMALMLREGPFWAPEETQAAATRPTDPQPPPAPELGPRHQWSYEEWVAQLQREADAIAENQPPRLSVLAGDSISLWFPSDLLPTERHWLNQGISGEISSGLLNRLDVFEQTDPETIFIMIGINDLIRGIGDETIVANQTLIVQDLKEMHPNAQIVLQSILPHGAEQATWEGKEQLLEVPNHRIQTLNERLKIVADQEDIYYLDLYSLFSNAEGNLRPELTTDGLHLNSEGYLVWRSAIQLFSQIELQEGKE